MSSQTRLRAARKKRHKITAVMRALENGQVTLGELLEDPPACLGPMRIYTLLMRAPKLGEAGTKKVLVNAQVWPTDRIGNIDEDARRRIISNLPPRAKGD